MTRDQLQNLARERILDARALLDGARWSFAYDHVGYAVECALKSAFLARMPITGWVFQDKVEDCRTHDFEKLINLSGLRTDLLDGLTHNKALAINWARVRTWEVESRYSLAITEQKAKDLFLAITDRPDGVLE